MALSDSDATSSCQWPEDLTFTGSDDPAECERFLGAVRKHAYVHGKQRDSGWITDLVSSCLSGEALRWHVMLPAEVVGDWSKLQRAFVEEFAPSARVAKKGLPMLSLDASPTSVGVEDASKVDIRPSALFGVIEAQSSELEPRTYISEEPNNAGRMFLMQNIKNALRLRSIDVAEPHNLQIATYSHNGRAVTHTYALLGATRMIMEESDHFYEDERFYLTLTNPAPSSTMVSSWKRGRCGETKSAVWSVSGNNDVKVTWNEVELFPMIGISNNTKERTTAVLTLAVSATEFSKRHQGGTFKYHPAKLLFKPLEDVYDQRDSSNLNSYPETCAEI